MSRITVRIDDLIGQLNELKRDGAEKVLLEIEEKRRVYVGTCRPVQSGR